MVILEDSKKGLDINFEQGSIAAKSNNADRKLNIKSGETTVALTSGDVNLNKSEKELNVNVNSGTADLQSGGQTQSIDSTKMARITNGAAKVENVKIRLLSPEPGRNILTSGNSSVTFRWQSSSDKASTLQIAGSADFSDITASKQSNGSSTVNLGEGVYYWRVLSEGQLSQVRRVAIISEANPVLLRPYDSQQFHYRDNRPLVTFTWNGADSANRFVVDVARDSGMTSIVKSLQSNGNVISTDSLDNGTYYCRIKAIYNLPSGKKELVSSTRSFVISKSAQIKAPALITPHNNKKILATQVSTIFNWKLVNEASKYTIMVYKASNSESIINSVVSSNFFTLTSKLSPGEYRWRVVAVADDGVKSEPSNEGRFQITSTGEIKTVTPSDKRRFENPGSIRFSWQDTGAGNRYLVQISKDPLFVSTYKERQVTSRSTSFSDFTGGTYYWKVFQLNDSGRRLISSNTSSFVIPGSVTNPLLIAPKNKKYPFNTNQVSFSWRRVSNATHYEVQILKQSFPQSEVITQRVLQNTSFSYNIAQLKPGRYSWKVRAIQRSGGKELSKSGFTEEYFTKEIKIVEKLPKPKIKTPSTIFVE